MSKSIPFLVKPDKLDGSMAGDMGFDPMRLSDIQTDLKYARWSEIKHGRICMLAIVGILVQQAGIHLPGEQFTNTDIFGAVDSVGFGANMQIFAGIGAVEIATFNKHYGEGEPGDLGFDGGQLKGASADKIALRKEQEIVHCRLAMIAFLGAMGQTLLFGQALP
jgi:light-harvesting complex I chlorophyll a/b binding protein 1